MDRQAPFRLMEPDRLASGAVFNSPHSGRDYPAGLVRRSRLSVQPVTPEEWRIVLKMGRRDAAATGTRLTRSPMPRK